MDAPNGGAQWTRPMDAPNGRTQWTGIFEYPHFGLLGHEKSHNFTVTASIDHSKRELVPNGCNECEKRD